MLRIVIHEKQIDADMKFKVDGSFSVPVDIFCEDMNMRTFVTPPPNIELNQ